MLPLPLELPDLPPALAAAHARLVAELWLAAGAHCAVAAIGCLACRWRRAGLTFGLAYCATLCLLPEGHGRILGPVGAAFALAGLCRPIRPRR